MLQAALVYARAGYKVMPCDNGEDKGPLTEHGKNDATTDEAQIRAWWTRWPDASIGLPLKINGLFALDIDRHKDKPDGLRAWDTVCFKHEIPKRTAVMAISGGKTPGQHMIYQHPGGEDLLRADPKNSIDPRDDQYILVEPSKRTDTGRSYKWIKGHSILEVKPAPMPANLLKWLTRKPGTLGGDVSDATVELLVRHHWRVVGVVEDNVRLRKPGKDTGHQASWNGKVFYIYTTTEAPPFEPEGRYTEAQVFELLRGSETKWFKDKVEALVDKASTDHAGRSEWLNQLAKLLTKADPLMQASVASKLGGANVCQKTTFVNQIKFYQKKVKSASREKITSVTTEEYAKLFETFKFHLRLNECNDDVELNGRYCDDIGLARISTTIADWAIKRPEKRISYKHLENAMTVVAAEDSYHPVKEYLEGLEWDGEDHLGEVTEYLEGEHFEIWFRHWAVAAVAKVYEQYQSPMLVLSGKTGSGKSTFVEWLSPEGLYAQEPINPNNHDCRIRMWTTWIWEVAELGASMKKTVQEALKWLLTLGVLRERKSYGHRDTIKPVTASFIGTVNPDAGFLWDRTGNRRYLVTEVTDIDWDYKEDLDPDQLWAQAKALYDADDTWKLTEDEEDLRDEVNLGYMGPSVILEILANLYRPATGPNKHNEYVWASDVIEDLMIAGYRSAHQNFALKEVVSIFRTWGSIGIDKTIEGKRGTLFPGVVKVEGFSINIGDSSG